MSIRYYAHFLLDRANEPEEGLQEYRGVVEVDGGRRRPGRDLRDATAIIARNFGRPTRDVRVLQWARLH